MIELRDDSLVFRFPDHHPNASLTINFQRTLRIPDDGKEYPLPPGLGRFPLRHVDDFTKRLPPAWRMRGGVMLPMYRTEALWMNFDGEYIHDRDTEYPYAVKVAAGKICALSGKPWSEKLHRRPQDYLVVPEQPWLDGYCVEKGIIRQFVAMPLGEGYSAEEQLTGKAEFGGLQIMVFPMRRDIFETRFSKQKVRRIEYFYSSCEASMGMGMAPGGRMRQEIFKDPFQKSDWDIKAGLRVFVHLADAMLWRAITGNNPPTVPLTAREYSDMDGPWFDYRNEGAEAIDGAKKLAELKSILEKANQKGDPLPPDFSPVKSDPIITIIEGKGRKRRKSHSIE
ncbi:MAG: hypothetical protein JXA62_01560 [Candidatus Aminicenantes bacterium]|nr:hypothetical protein [Candidatus Aminicenantes bacterium]